MTVSRRQFLAGASALSLAVAWPAAGRGQSSREATLRAGPGAARLGPAGFPETPIWGYEGGTPGPTLRVRQGERLVRRFANGLPQPSTVHWHGIRIANAMDGVPGLTQSVVPPGESFLYDFVAPDAGTFWYHPHNRTWEQMARGLYGALIVEEAEPPEVDRDEVLLIDDWRLERTGRIAEDFGAMMDWSHGGRMGNWITVNGRGEFALPVRRHARLRLRLVNTANARIFPLSLERLAGWVVALDGQPLARPEPAGPIVLAPAQRVDLIVDVVAEEGGEARLVMPGDEGPYPVARFPVSGEARSARLGTPPPLPQNPVAGPGALSQAQRVTLRMEGGAMGGMRGAMMGGRMRGMRDLVTSGKVWAFNGSAEMPDKPLVSAAAGETVRIVMANDTAWPHAMHLHGHHFRKILAGDALGPLRDTLLVDRNETAEIAFLADNPGDWLLHCHMLEHADAGMMTWLKVT